MVGFLLISNIGISYHKLEKLVSCVQHIADFCNNLKRLLSSESLFGVLCVWKIVLFCYCTMSFDLSYCADQKSPCFFSLPRIFRLYGIYPGRRFYDIYGQHMAMKVGNPDISFKQVSFCLFLKRVSTEKSPLRFIRLVTMLCWRWVEKLVLNLT